MKTPVLSIMFVKCARLALAMAVVPAIALAAGHRSAGGAVLSGCQVEITGETCCACEWEGVPPEVTRCEEAEEDGSLACGSTWCPPPGQIECTID